MEEGVEMEERRILGTEIDMTPVWECKRMFREKRFSEYRRCIGRSKEAARHDFLGESLFFESLRSLGSSLLQDVYFLNLKQILSQQT